MSRKIVILKPKDKELIKNKQNALVKDESKITKPQETIFASDVHIFTKQNKEKKLVTKEEVINQLFGTKNF